MTEMMWESSHQGTLERIFQVMGAVPFFRSLAIEGLRSVARRRPFSERWREEVHWPLVQSLMTPDRTYRIRLRSGLYFEITAASVIEKNVLISPEHCPDHLWEPYTTRLLLQLAEGKQTVLIGGAYIGDQALPIAQKIAPCGGRVYAFEPMEEPLARLRRNCLLNAITNLVAEPLALWDTGGETLELSGSPALARTVASGSCLSSGEHSQFCRTTTIDEYLEAQGRPHADLIMLDLEGGELRALQGAEQELRRPPDSAPCIVFEIHAQYADWSRGVEKTEIVEYLQGHGYTVYGIRDYHHCYPVPDTPTELIPAALINTDGPPHGFNMLAIRKPDDLERHFVRIVRGGSPRQMSPKLLLREMNHR